MLIDQPTYHGLHEAQILARVPHAGVVPIYSVGQDEDWGLTVLCMPFISRATLLDVIEIVHAERRFPGDAPGVAGAEFEEPTRTQDGNKSMVYHFSETTGLTTRMQNALTIFSTQIGALEDTQHLIATKKRLNQVISLLWRASTKMR